MHTSLGRQLQQSRRTQVAATVVGVLAIVADLTLVVWAPSESLEGRTVVVLVGLGLLVYLSGGDLPSLGLIPRPAPDWGFWVRVTLLVALALPGFVLAGFGLVWWLTDGNVPLYATAPHDLGSGFLHACLYSPVLEETLYRVLLCVPLAAWGRPWLAVLVSGVVFAGLHFAYGNPSPENMIGGFVLAWAYLRSGSVVVPLLWHAGGNLNALAGQIAVWFILHGASAAPQ